MTRPTVTGLAEQVAELRGAVQSLADAPPVVLPELPELLPLLTAEPVVVAPWASVRKALVAGAVAAAGALGTALLGGDLTAAEGYVALGAGLLALAAAYKVENVDTDAA